jgi:eukaryotic-like serine/threonine-protein kinase
MDQDRWSTINRIFHAALEVDPRQRHVVVAAASNGDPELQAEVELLLQADAEIGSYLESPLIPAQHLPPSLVPGDVLCGRFRIIREIAEGGMGQVFEAFDSELAVQVALKVIRPEISSNLEAIARFRQEVRLARSITHPNICRTFDIEREVRDYDGQHTELVFLTMEFLPGETLAARIKRNGPLPLSEALSFARQIAAALHAAHALGIIHRDMKPANIMLVAPGTSSQEDPRAVVTDFGLARLDPLLLAEGLSSFTHTGNPIGTLAYMSPEQLEGAAVSSATDIYAFGLILFEMVTGKRAFPSDNFLGGISQRLRGSLVLEQMFVPEVPANWRRALKACLQVKPSNRPQDTNDVLKMLEDGRPRLFPQLGIRHRRLPGISLLLATFLVVMALLAGGLRLYQSRADSKVNPGALVYLTNVSNQTGEKSFDTLTELIQAGLSQSIQVNLLDQGRIGDIVQQMTKSPETAIDANTAREVAMRAGAVRVIFATVTGSHGKYSLNIDIQQLDNTPVRYRDRWTKNFTWQTDGPTGDSSTIPNELLTQVRSASNWIRHEVGESANDIARLDVPPEDVTTSSWEALSEYTAAERLIGGRQQEKAVDALRNAVQIDPKFAFAYARLADVLDSMGREAEGYQAYRQALNVDIQSRLTRRERDRIRGMFALDTGDEQAAEAAFRDYATYYEDDYAGWFFRAYPLMMLGRTPEAIETLRRAYAIDPGRVSAPAHLARYYMILNNLPEAWKWQRWLEAHGYKDDANFVAGQLELDEGKYVEGERSFRSLPQSRDPYYQSLGQSLLARYYAERGDTRQALAATEKGIAVDKLNGFAALQASKLVDRVLLQCRLHDSNNVAGEIRDALKLHAGWEVYISASSVLGECQADVPMSGKRFSDVLEVLLKELPGQDDSLISQIAAHRVRGELLLTKGARKEALTEFLKASRIEEPASNLEYLGRAYLAVSEQDADATAKAANRAKALEIYHEISAQPALTWNFMLALSPGMYANSLEIYLRYAAHPEGGESDEMKRLLQVYIGLRGRALSKTSPAGVL